jgi:formate dehydrogenase subunit gamma
MIMSNQEPKMIKRFSIHFRIAHWAMVLSFLMLYMSGLPMYTEFFDWLYVIFGGPAGARLVHRIMAVVFICIPIYQLIFDSKSIIHWLKQCLSWHSRDIKMITAFPKEFFTGHTEVPKQDFFNGGEKINSLLQMVCWVMLVGSGLVMWFPGYFSEGIISWAFPIHNIALGLAIAVVIGHIYLSVGHPNSRASLRGMTKGEVPAEYAKAHHGRWYDEVMEEEKNKNNHKGA